MSIPFGMRVATLACVSTRANAKAATRERLIAAGLDLVRQRGFAVTVDELAKAAGLTKGAIYSNFADRSELIEAISDRLHHNIDVQINLEKDTITDAALDLGRQIGDIVDNERSSFILTLDYLVQLLRDDALRERVVPRSAILAEKDDLRRGEWIGHYEIPLPGDQFNTVINALGTGLGVYRALMGREVVTDELIEWAFTRMTQPGPAAIAGPATTPGTKPAAKAAKKTSAKASKQ